MTFDMVLGDASSARRKPLNNFSERLFPKQSQEYEPSFNSSLRVWRYAERNSTYLKPCSLEEVTSSEKLLLETFVNDFESKESVFALSQLSSLLKQKIESENYDPIDYLMKNLELESVSLTMQVALLRYTFPVRCNIEAWPSFREKVKASIELHGQNSEQLLIGL